MVLMLWFREFRAEVAGEGPLGQECLRLGGLGQDPRTGFSAAWDRVCKIWGNELAALRKLVGKNVFTEGVLEVVEALEEGPGPL